MEKYLINQPCDIILLSGQSNAVGYGLGEASEEVEDHADVLLFHDTQVEGYEKGEDGKDYLTVKEPFIYNTAMLCEGGIGNFVSMFAKHYVQDGRLQSGRKLLVVRTAVGGTGFSKHEWTEDGILFRRTVAMLSTALSMHKENRVVAFCWHQGESDAFERQDWDSETRRTFYETHFTKLIHTVRKISKNAALPVMAAGFADEWSALYREQCDAVMEAIQATFQKVGHARFISAEGLLSNNQQIGNGDDIHFSKESQHILGKKYYQAFVDILEKD